jgi:P-type Mg2+ transporter
MNQQYSGLTSSDAKSRLLKSGPNLSKKVNNGLLTILIKQFQSPILYLLILTAIISILTGDVVASFVLIVLIVINTAIGFTQEYQSNSLANKLSSLVSAQTLCLRDEKYTFINSSELVVDDIIKLKLGDVVPADCISLECENILVDESALTGETENIFKSSNQELSSGTHIVQGTGIFKITRTGANSKIGTISNLALNTTKTSEFNKQMLALSRGFMLVGLVFLVVIFGLHLALGKVESWQATLIFILALTISIIPEALPIVTSITLSNQAYKLGQQGLLVKHQTVLEDLGNMDVFCSDKTGTITENKFHIVSSDYNKELLQAAQFLTVGSNDNFDIAVSEYNNNFFKPIDPTLEVVEIPFDPIKRYSGKTIISTDTSILHGSPKEILNLIPNLDNNSKDQILLDIESKEKNGIKCLSYATITESNSTYLGTLFFQDILKSDAIELVSKCEDIGIELKILTGDTLNVARHIGYESKMILDDTQAISTEEIDWNLNKSDLYNIVNKYKIIARCTPEQKFKIIQALQTHKVVGYLGDGINDAPALKAAQIGIVVDTSSAIAKETSDIIMTSKSLNTLIEGILKGRGIFENINKYLKATLSSSFGNFFTMGLLSLVLPFNPMLGIQVILSDLITDLPLISLSDDSVNAADVRKPKHQNLPRLIIVCLTLGLVSSLFDFIFVAVNKGLPEGQIQTSWFFFSIVTELAILFSIRTRGPFFFGSKPKLRTVIYSLLALIVTVLISSYLFKFVNITTIGTQQLGMLIGLALCYFAISECVKVVYYRVYSQNVE